MFVSRDTLKGVEDQIQINFSLPKQLQYGLVEAEVKEKAKQGLYGMTSIMIVQIIVQIVMKGAMDLIFDLYMKLQLINCLKEFKIYRTALVEIYFEQLDYLVEFKMLDPDFLLKLIDKNLTIENLMTGKYWDKKQLKNVEVEDDKGSPKFLITVLMVLITLFVFAILVKLFSYIWTNYREMVDNFLKEQKKEWMWNESLRSIYEIYLG